MAVTRQASRFRQRSTQTLGSEGFLTKTVLLLVEKSSFKKKHSQLQDRETPLIALPQHHREHRNAHGFKSEVPATPGANHFSPESCE